MPGGASSLGCGRQKRKSISAYQARATARSILKVSSRTRSRVECEDTVTNFPTYFRIRTPDPRLSGDERASQISKSGANPI